MCQGNRPFSDTLDLVDRVKSGDPSATERLFERYLPRIRQIAALRLGVRVTELADFEDLVQESMLDAFSGLSRFEAWHEGSFRHWVATIVKNNIGDHWKRFHAEKRGSGRVRSFSAYESTVLLECGLAGDAKSPSEMASARELEQRLERALLDLDERHRRVIDLRKLCGLSYGEIADQMNLGGESSARSLFARAVSRLSGIL